MNVVSDFLFKGEYPYWSSYIEALPGSRDTGDPLGFREAAKQIARKLVPDLTQRTRMTRGFSLLVCGLDQSNRGNSVSRVSPTERFLRFEALIVLARVHKEGVDNLTNCFLAGQRGAARLLKRSDFPVRLDQRILTRQLASGLWGTYRVAAEKLQLLQGGGTTPARNNLGNQGRKWVQKVTNNWDQSLKTRLTRAITLGEADEDLLDELAKTELGCSDKASEDEAVLLSAAIRFAQGEDGPLHCLRKIYDAAGVSILSVSDLVQKINMLTDKQRLATTSASALLELMAAIEQPFREGMTDENANPVLGANASQDILWDDLMPCLDASAKANLINLRKSIANGGFEEVLVHHQKISQQRGAAPWIRGVLPDDLETYSPPDFTLSAASQIFSEKVKP